MVFADIRSLCKPIISYFTPIFLTLISYIFELKIYIFCTKVQWAACEYLQLESIATCLLNMHLIRIGTDFGYKEVSVVAKRLPPIGRQLIPD